MVGYSSYCGNSSSVSSTECYACTLHLSNGTVPGFHRCVAPFTVAKHRWWNGSRAHPAKSWLAHASSAPLHEGEPHAGRRVDTPGRRTTAASGRPWPTRDVGHGPAAADGHCQKINWTLPVYVAGPQNPHGKLQMATVVVGIAWAMRLGRVDLISANH